MHGVPHRDLGSGIPASPFMVDCVAASAHRRRSEHRPLGRVIHRTARGAVWPALALAALACAGSHESTQPTVLAKIPDRIIVLPLNVATAMPAELKSDGPAVWSALEAALRSHGSQLKTLSAANARGIWLASAVGGPASFISIGLYDHRGYKVNYLLLREIRNGVDQIVDTPTLLTE